METWFVPRLPVPPASHPSRSISAHTQRHRLSFRCLARYRLGLRLGLRMGLRLGRVFNDGAEHIKQVDNVIPSTSEKGTQFQEL